MLPNHNESRITFHVSSPGFREHPLLILLIINTILAIGSGVASLGMVMGAGYASEGRRGKGTTGNAVMLITFILPLTAVVSIAGSWISYLLGNDGAAYIFMALPWVNMLASVGGMVFLTRR